ncbi:Non-functional nadph-dependent codeinone reductase [Thalictrum thalictroides]|uniref:Non-functional nadph-dependent codeinone reductase n=1 Tax=Thalictrum thalictroides TaxID=46969 RepID=A0A7J6USR7_THATH|nr:Non-functional nadph-dependent codeinone reductase [Thalictrum thalictroides]
MSIVPDVVLSSGHKMPLIGFGTVAYPIAASDSIKTAIVNGIKHGYRHFDTASVYQTEQLLGEAIAEALQLGLIKSRQELFITSKLWCSDSHHDRVLPALHNTLKTLQLDYLDLYLVHWPISSKPGKHEYPIPKEELLPLDFESVWAAMEECQALGLTKSIGVSNFSPKKLEQLLSTSKIPPAVNQVEMNPVWQQNKLREFCKSKGIVITAFSPLGAKGTTWGTNKVMDSEVLNEIAQAKGRTHAQVCLRWLHEQGICVVVKSFSEERMKGNLEIFDWEMSPEESALIQQLPQSRGHTGEDFISVDGPFKSLEELWDGEI